MKINGKIIGAVAVVIVAIVIIAAAGLIGSSDENELQFGYVTWDGEIASTNVLTLVLEEAGYDVSMVAVDAGPLYQSLAKGELDFTTSTWMPVTHASYMDKYGDRLERVGENLEVCKIGLAVPQYVYDAGVKTISDLKVHGDKFSNRIVGIDPGAGVMMATDRAVEDYGLTDYEVRSSSSGSMLAELKRAYANEDWIAVTLWSPHWAFSEWDLVYLEDPKESYGGVEVVETVSRTGFADDNPGAYAIIQAFNWTQDDCQSVMLDINSKNMDERDAAQKWIDAHREKVDSWISAGKAAADAAKETA
ncbi:MAG: glycine betaine ABC transporter substrate-binding protein [Euryarchaeota archaeon]|nr:glycine betaine ABC transporter substrate-binding protein [Euryarchaeota archaeon]